eukprot:356244-Chlamydomonas_euryale.AAC.10
MPEAQPESRVAGNGPSLDCKEVDPDRGQGLQGTDLAWGQGVKQGVHITRPDKWAGQRGAHTSRPDQGLGRAEHGSQLCALSA